MPRPILLVAPADFPTCPEDGRRMATRFINEDGMIVPTMVETDDGELLFEAVCPEHGTYLFRILNEGETAG